MKRIFPLILLLLLVVPVQDAPARGYTRLLLPEGTRDRFGEALLSGDIAYAPNGALLAVPSSIGIWLYNPRNGQLRDHLDTGFVRSVALASDSRTLASGGSREIRLWQSGTGRLMGVLDGYPGFVRSVAFAPDGRTLAGAGGGEIRLWDALGGQLEAVLEGHVGEVESLVFSPDGRTLASGGGDYTIRLWDVGKRPDQDYHGGAWRPGGVGGVLPGRPHPGQRRLGWKGQVVGCGNRKTRSCPGEARGVWIRGLGLVRNLLPGR